MEYSRETEKKCFREKHPNLPLHISIIAAGVSVEVLIIAIMKLLG